MNRLPWRDLLRFGLGDLHLTPDVFWSLTPDELMFMAGATDNGARLTRNALNELMGKFPDPDDVKMEK